MLGFPDMKNIPSLIHDTRLCQKDAKMSNNLHGTKHKNTNPVEVNKAYIAHTSSQKIRKQKLSCTSVFNKCQIFTTGGI